MNRLFRAAAIALLIVAPLRAQAPPQPAPAGDVIGVGNFAHIVADLDRSLGFYRDVLGLAVTNTIPFGPNEAVAKFGHTEGGQSRVAVLRVPGLAMGIELIEYKDIARTPQRPHFVDPGAANMALRVRDLDTLFPKIEKYPGVTVLTAGGKPVTITTPNGVLHVVFIQDPDGFVVEMLDAPNPPADSKPASVIGGSAFEATVRDSAQTVKFYNELLGFNLQLGAAFNDNAQMAATAGAPGASFRQSRAQFPGTTVPFTLIEFKNAKRKELSGRTQDPGTTVLQLIVRDVTALTAKLKAAGVPIVTTGGAPVQVSPTLKIAIVRDPNNMLLELAERTAGSAAGPASSFPRGNSKQAWQDPGHAAAIAKCKTPPMPFAIPIQEGPATNAAPPEPVLPASTAIPGVVAAGQTWKTVWAWEGNNTDGIIPGDKGTLMFANNDASNVMRLDPATGLATIVHRDVNTGGALSRSKTGALFLVSRGLHPAVIQLEPQRKVFANSFRGEPLDCIGGVLNDLSADARGGVYFTVSGSGLYYANPKGVVSQYGEGLAGANGIVLSADEKILYITAGPIIAAFDVNADGSLGNQREFAKLRGGQGGDGATIDAEGRVYATTGSSVDVFSPKGEFLGSIPGPTMTHGVTFGGPDKKTLYAIVFFGAWGTPSARNRIIAMPMLAQGYMRRAK